ncbi:hypothetical protein [Shewanella surugensis]|uniref:ATP-grasp domain-containing protein n=1 Tax=Shewanella surugensis TaxID=212020 RepID=A0ABT0LCA6_9GAMM|nr:hypothetical protein [Shewanella surugensis]MCL1125343.1 hypothetical protein [Shewanella surugensis]
MSVNAKIRSIDDVKNYFATLDTPHYFISSTNFNLMNLEQWVKHWTNINFIDCYDKSNDSVMLPSKVGTPVFDSIESVNDFLLGHKDVVSQIEKDKSNWQALETQDPQAKALFLFFDRTLEETCRSLDLQVCLPPNHLVKKIDNKITTTEIGNQAGVASVPNALEKVSSYEMLRAIADEHQLGERLVVQSAYGDSGKTTYFISNESEYEKVAEEIESEEQVKIMKQIRCAGTAIEACATRAGTFVGPLMTELVGLSALTPYQGGWCGNELYQEAFSDSIRHQAQQMTENLGNTLYERGYKGYFEVDYLIDLDTGDLYLGELNPRITGISAMTNMSDFCYKTVPLFLFHLLEYSDIAFDINPSEYNQLALKEGAISTSGQVIFKYTHSGLKIITAAPESGVYKLVGDELTLMAKHHDRRQALAEDEVFIMRIMGSAEYAYKGADLAIVFTHFRLQSAEKELTGSAAKLIDALQARFTYRELTEEEEILVERYNSSSSLKGASYADSDIEDAS